MTDPAPSPSSGRRLLSLDVLRGLTIAFMIMVNNNGGHDAWTQMHHAEWNGMTATDLVFPTFLFVVGISIVFAFEARLAKGARRAELAWHTARRAAILIVFGIVVNSFPYFHLDHMRFYGVLQRIGICYLIVGLFYLFDRRVWTKVVALAACLIGYWALVCFVPAPGEGMPGRDVPLLDKDHSIVAWVDRQLMPGHLYEERPGHNNRDPEGLLSDIPALGTTLLGVLTGLWLRSGRDLKTKAAGLVTGAVACLASGYVWSIWFPLNKKMWTSSYVLAAAGWSLAALALAFCAVELLGWGKKDTPGVTGKLARAAVWPWLVFGSNAIAAYMVSELIPGLANLASFTEDGKEITILSWLRIHLWGLVPNAGWACFGYSVSYTAVCFIPIWILYRKKIFLKV